MDEAAILQNFQTAMQIVAIVTLPPLLVAMAAGLVISILQAATQIQDQTLPLTVKIIAVGLTMAAFGISLANPLLEFSRRIFQDFPILAR
jgi:type III secretion protein S